MSERSLRPGLFAACAAALTLALAAPAGAQTAAEWRLRLDRAQALSARADSNYVRVRDSSVVTRTSRLVAGGRTVRYAKSEVTPDDSARVAAGLERGRAHLVARFGALGPRLLDEGDWVLAAWNDPRPFAMELELYPAGSRARGIQLRRAVDPALVEGFVVQMAGDGIPSLAPALWQLRAGTPSLTDDPALFAAAGRELALSWSAVARRCLTGALPACRAALTVPEPEDRLTHFFDPSDWRAIIVASSPPIGADSAFFASRRECIATGEPACAAIIHLIVPPLPLSGSLRATFITHALTLGGSAAIERLIAAPQEDPIALLAHVAGVSEDALIASWRTRVVDAVAVEQGIPIPVILAIVGWGVLALAAATWRRP